MEFQSTTLNSYWLTEFERDITKLNKNIDYYKMLIQSENKQPKPRLRKIIFWNEEIRKIKTLLDLRTKAIDKINNK